MAEADGATGAFDTTSPPTHNESDHSPLLGPPHNSTAASMALSVQINATVHETPVALVETDTLPSEQYKYPLSASQIEIEHKVEDALGIEHISPQLLTMTPSSTAEEENEADVVHFQPPIPAAEEQSWTNHSEESSVPVKMHVSKSHSALSKIVQIDVKETPSEIKTESSGLKKLDVKRKSEEKSSLDYVNHGGIPLNECEALEFHVRVGHYGIQGRRMTMEDQHTQFLHPEFNKTCGLEDNVPRSFFAVRRIFFEGLTSLSFIERFLMDMEDLRVLNFAVEIYTNTWFSLRLGTSHLIQMT